jgi:thiosulfate/3-mercaptopyruvate sulfurtransferase
VIRILALPTVTALLAAPFSAAAPAEVGPIVSVEWLAAHATDPDLVLLHIGPDAEYAKAHLAGAHLITRDMLQAPRNPEVVLDMPDEAKLRADFAALGITDKSTVVVVSDQGWVTPATRVLVTLLYAGFAGRVAVLDGGQPEWVRAGHPVTAVVPAAGGGSATPRLDRSILTDVRGVQAAIDGAGPRIIDARAPVYYDGPSHGDHPAGHIPGAVNIPYTSLVDDHNLMKSPEELRALFAAAGIREGDDLIVYCHIGQQATLAFTAARILGHRVRLYDGSFDDWARRKLPVESSKAGG